MHTKPLPIRKMQKEADKISKEFDEILSDKMQGKLARLIELELLIEEECNK